MTYLRITSTGTEWPYSRQQLLADNPNVSFRLEPTAEELAPFGVYIVEPSEPPGVDPSAYKVIEVQPALIDGRWIQQWEIKDLSEEEKETFKQMHAPAPRGIEFSLALMHHPAVISLMNYYTNIAEPPMPHFQIGRAHV